MEASRPSPPDRDEVRIWREASKTVAVRGVRDLATVRAELRNELARRGLSDIHDEHLDLLAKNIIDGRGPLGGLRLARTAWKQFAKAVEILRAPEGPEWLEAPAGDDVDARSWQSVSVEVPDEAQPFLLKAFEALYEPDYDEYEEVAHTVWIPVGEHTQDAKGRTQVRLGRETVGWLGPRQLETLARPMKRATRRNRPLRLEGFISRSPSGVSLSLNVPLA